MKEYIASVKDKYTGKQEIKKANDYNSKAEFAKDLRGNGYSVRFISTEENFDADCEKFHERIAFEKAVRERRKQFN